MTFDQNIQIRVNGDVLADIDRLAEELELTRSELIRQWVLEKVIENTEQLEGLEKRELMLTKSLKVISERIFTLKQKQELEDEKARLEKEQNKKSQELDSELSKLKNLSLQEQLESLKDLEKKWSHEELLVKKIIAKRKWIEWEIKMKK